MKKYLGWIIGAVALVALIAGATLLYDKLGADYQPEGGGVEELGPWEGFEEPTTPPEEIETPPASETEPPATETDPPQTETQPPVETEPPKVTLKAPDFTVRDMSGNYVKLSDYTGKPIIVNFWATWCTYCVREMPDFEAMYKKYGDRVNFLMVNVEDTSLSIIQKYLDNNGYTFPVYNDASGTAAYTYGVTGYPTTYFFDANGSARYKAPGMIDGATLESIILELLNS